MWLKFNYYPNCSTRGSAHAVNIPKFTAFIIVDVDTVKLACLKHVWISFGCNKINRGLRLLCTCVQLSFDVSTTGMAVGKVSIINTGIQGHWQWCHSIGHMRFPITAVVFHCSCLYLAPLTRYHQCVTYLHKC